jgi:hypothetical protein
MSVVGIDFGAQSTKVGVARNKGIDIVRICPSAASVHILNQLLEQLALTLLSIHRSPMKFPTDLLRMCKLSHQISALISRC